MAGSVERSQRARPLKIVLIADLHAGADTGSQRGSQVLALLPGLVEEMRAFRPDLVVDLGDRINNESAEADLARTRRVRELLMTIGAPLFFVRGNHDTRHIDRAAYEEATGQSLGYRSLDLLGRRLIFLDTAGGPDGLPSIDSGQIEQLRWDTKSAPGPIVVFSHHPLDGHPMDANPLFDDAAYVHPPQGPQVRAILALGPVVAAFSGHAHWYHARHLGGMFYMTVPGFGEAWSPDGVIQAAYARVVHWFEAEGSGHAGEGSHGSFLDVTVTPLVRTGSFTRKEHRP